MLYEVDLMHWAHVLLGLDGNMQTTNGIRNRTFGFTNPFIIIMYLIKLIL